MYVLDGQRNHKLDSTVETTALRLLAIALGLKLSSDVRSLVYYNAIQAIAQVKSPEKKIDSKTQVQYSLPATQCHILYSSPISASNNTSQKLENNLPCLSLSALKPSQ